MTLVTSWQAVNLEQLFAKKSRSKRLLDPWTSLPDDLAIVRLCACLGQNTTKKTSLYRSCLSSIQYNHSNAVKTDVKRRSAWIEQEWMIIQDFM